VGERAGHQKCSSAVAVTVDAAGFVPQFKLGKSDGSAEFNSLRVVHGFRHSRPEKRAATFQPAGGRGFLPAIARL
jgi:hypothetical protein